ncbi:MAG: hypothetical protein WCB15_15305 [Desulfobacterales bacterium]
MIIFTIPYPALQPMAAGYALEALLGLPYFYGCLVVTAIILVCSLRGFMSALLWSENLLQLVIPLFHHSMWLPNLGGHKKGHISNDL